MARTGAPSTPGPPLGASPGRRRHSRGRGRAGRGLTSMRVVVGGRGTTGRAVRAALSRRDVEAVAVGSGGVAVPARGLRGSDAVYLIAPKMQEDEPDYVAEVLAAMAQAPRASGSPTSRRSPRQRSSSPRGATSARRTSWPRAMRPRPSSRPRTDTGRAGSMPWSSTPGFVRCSRTTTGTACRSAPARSTTSSGGAAVALIATGLWAVARSSVRGGPRAAGKPPRAVPRRVCIARDGPGPVHGGGSTGSSGGRSVVAGGRCDGSAVPRHHWRQCGLNYWRQRARAAGAWVGPAQASAGGARTVVR